MDSLYRDDHKPFSHNTTGLDEGETPPFSTVSERQTLFFRNLTVILKLNRKFPLVLSDLISIRSLKIRFSNMVREDDQLRCFSDQLGFLHCEYV